MKWIIDNLITLFYALIIAIIIRSLIIQPFYIPSSSMEPNLLVGDRLLLQSIAMVLVDILFHLAPLFKNRIMYKFPEPGDVVVFKTPADNRTDYIKRLIGIPGDIIQFIDGDLYINNNQVLKTLVKNTQLFCGPNKIKLIYMRKNYLMEKNIHLHTEMIYIF